VISTRYLVEDADAMRELGVQVSAGCAAGDVLLLVGRLGAGKTTFTQGLAKGLGVAGAVTSPTFVIAREHRSASKGPALVHVDAYRLGNIDELDDLDLDASLADSVTVVEWGEGLVEHLGASVIRVHIERSQESPSNSADDDGSDVREVTIAWPEGRP
jgi:tRNA threonylcarbamoyladenosine biosynthesis protein TsaE